MIGQAGQMVTQIVDNAMLGQYDTTALAAAAFSQNVFNVFFIFGLGFSIGITPLVGRANAAENTQGMAHLLKASLTTNLGLTCLLFGGLLLLYPYLHLFGQPKAVVLRAQEYYPWLISSLFPIMLFFTAKHFLDGAEYTKPMMFITIVGNLLNVLLNHMLIYGNWGAPELGLEGAAIATFTTRVVQGLGLIGFIFVAARYTHLKAHFLSGWLPLKTWKRLASISVGIGFQLLVEVAAFSFGAILVGTLGDVPLASHQIAIGLASLTFLIASGISTASTIRISNLLGAGTTIRDIIRHNRASVSMVVAFMSITGITFMVFGRSLAELHSGESDVIELATTLLFITGIFQLFDGLQVQLGGILRGFEDIKVPMLYATLSYLIIGFGLGAFFTKVLDWGAAGMWIGFCLGLALMSTLLVFRIRTVLRRYIKANQLNHTADPDTAQLA